MVEKITIQTARRTDLIDITGEIEEVIRRSSLQAGMCNVFVPHATAGIIINENDDPNIILDFLDVLKRIAPQGTFRHDSIDGNGDAHIKSAIIGASETIPFSDGKLLLGTWQSVMFCEFDGPKFARNIILTLIQG